jgi:UDP-glucose 4-epimerase
MKILVTGGAGFIGSNLADALVEKGFEVVIVDNLSTGFKEFLPPQAKFYLNDICDRQALQSIFSREKPSFVFHLAAQIDVRKSVEDPAFDANCNILGSLNLIDQALVHNVSRFIYISTGGAIYGEPQFLPVTEDHPINPLCNYGVSKHAVEHYLYQYQKNFDLKYTVLRLPNVYGPRQNPLGEAGVNAIFIHKMLEGQTPTIFGDGQQLRDYVYVSDIVSACLCALERGDNQIFNIGCGTGTSVNEIYRSLQQIIGFAGAPIYAPPRKGEVYKIYLDASKANRIMNWAPQVPFYEGLVKTVEWHKACYGS